MGSYCKAPAYLGPRRSAITHPSGQQDHFGLVPAREDLHGGRSDVTQLVEGSLMQRPNVQGELVFLADSGADGGQCVDVCTVVPNTGAQ